MALEETLRNWAKRPSDSEQDRIDRTERMIKAAILKSNDSYVSGAKVFAKGSVKAGTNIKKDSDIDICVQPYGVFFANYSEGLSDKDFGNSSSTYTFKQFRDNVESALIDHFGSAYVSSGNRHINIREKTSRVEADVVPAFEHRRYTSRNSNPLIGIELRHKVNGSKTVNWPRQNYDNNLAKYNSTYRRYRKMVRILKHIREELNELYPNASFDAQSFLIESMLWNVPNPHYNYESYVKSLEEILNYLNYALQRSDIYHEWGEVNEFKYLFRGSQKWTVNGALQFVIAAQTFVEKYK
ncbi:nucleotidyltransferase domain-containing protein [Lactococcus garvieae]|uniref:nucleotidyltransferase domain-containing protein n=1 Tax=Lactococcus garvieae TaxID=1363 RepID=UPI003853C544